MRNQAITVLCLVSTPFFMMACSTLGSVVTAPELCQDWRRITRSKHDKLTQGTAAQIEASNLSRVEWGCDRKANKAAS